jgi:hypothetical protein
MNPLRLLVERRFWPRYGRAMSRPFLRIWSRVSVVVGEPVPPEELTAHELALRVAALGGWKAPEPCDEATRSET